MSTPVVDPRLPTPPAPGPTLPGRVFRRVAIAGNPNCGKSTLFNALTGLRQKVGNYPGVTVEKKIGRLSGSHGEAMEVLDLPGAYSLQVRSPDEAVARDVLLGRRRDTPRPEVVVCVVDAGNLERNLYFVAQVLELGLPVIVALNMVDVAERRGLVLDVPALSARLGVPVVRTIASRGVGLVELKQELSRATLALPEALAPMPPAIEEEAVALGARIGETERLPAPAARAEALLLLALEDRAELLAAAPTSGLADATAAAAARLRAAGVDPTADPVEARYAWVGEVIRTGVRASETDVSGAGRLSASDRLDAVLTHRVWGWAVFLALMGGMFFSIFTLAQLPMDAIKGGFEALGAWVGTKLPEGDFRSLLVDGVLAGVGGVVVFLPQILTLFFFIGLLEDTGYMARAAFIIDRVMTKVGLHGKSFIPMLSSFACAIPGIMATRTIEQRRDRLTTMLVAPLMSCSARLPVYTLLIAAMLPRDVASPWTKAGIMLAMYLLGMAAAFGMAWLFKRTLFRGETPMLILELPPYRWPSWRGVLIQMGQRAGLFLRRAGTVILAIAILLWAAATYPKPADPATPPSAALAQSLAGRMGHAIEPAIAPLGFDWKIGIGLVSSFAAREVFVGTMAVIYNVEKKGDDEGGTDLRDAIASETRADGRPVFTPLVCVSLMVFYVLAMQCMSTLAVVRRETNSWRWPLFQFAYMSALAYLGSLVVYQGGRLLGWG